ncbi:tetratricopeptide repeat protein [Tunturiibacter gelidoferens]|uniref:Tetratricopeptide (TPR) repeat protein n=1 Tax=Tunturiibacter lichenicola TaxID=2051959 RepID=A0A7Y9T509_9BACT|nr:tetratricopeptide repeat protein [Edaphobacter lichenicola]NYF54057.1 tetratricopeptide (TPR) repeat protein [Edaphobacter lichenicola]
MADQRFVPVNSEFFLDLHYTERAEAKRIARRRISECFKYGIKRLKIVYGSPDNFAGSIAESIFELVWESDLLALEMLPAYVFMRDPDPKEISTYVTLFIRENPTPALVDVDTSFEPFVAKFEKDIPKRLRCDNPYHPLRTQHTLEWTARAIGHGCTPAILQSLYSQQSVSLSGPGTLVSWPMMCEMAMKYRKEAKAGGSSIRQSADMPVQESEKAVPVSHFPPPGSTPSAQAIIASAVYLEEQSRYAEVEQLLNDLLTGTGDLLGSETEEAMLILGRVMMATNNAEAETMLLRAYEQREKRVPGTASMLPMIKALIEYYHRSGEFDRAKIMLSAASDIARDSFTSVSVSSMIAGALQAAQFEHFAGRHKQSLETLKDLSSLLDKRKLKPADNVLRFDLLGLNYLVLGRFLESEIAFKAALRIANKSRVGINARAHVLMHMGRLLRKTGRLIEAVATYEDGLSLLRGDEMGTHDFLRANLQSSRGVTLKTMGEYARAEEDYDTALELFERCGSQEHPEYAGTLLSRAMLHFHLNQLELADKRARAALAIIEMKVVADKYFLQTCYGSLFQIAKGRGRLAEAQDFYDRGLAVDR